MSINSDKYKKYYNNITKKYDEKLSVTDISLPPKVKGLTYYYLIVNINTLKWKDINYKKKYTSYGITTSRSTVKVRLQWWGDNTGPGTVFYPYVVGPNSTKTIVKPGNKVYSNNNDNKNLFNIQNIKNRNYKVTSAIYPICCDINELILYFKDMKNIVLDVIVDGSIMGKTVINDLVNITKTIKSIHDTYPVYLVSPKGNIKPSIIAELDIEFILQNNIINKNIENPEYSNIENKTEEINYTEEINNNSETLKKEEKEVLSPKLLLNTKDENNNNVNIKVNDNLSNDLPIKQNNEDSQLIFENILTNNEYSTNIISTKEPNESINDTSEYSIEKINEKLKEILNSLQLFMYTVFI
ncbi:hypothetical protein BCR36DRAFT_372789 [Piromyces finnis]|uniref:C2CD3 N-terminal C2 domain-containing protein n=1 Tax=Piromyces finnis TaxID=1754191 RepID=A0A1Y1V2Z9_9FUNG|nr:hypothetical protein BCR36DRAFT_372789 [Piromyces finnis]|eukprot:ORX45426.1 hypothetical protein BCR36DRAFT_372789 [Piromyces finnis]